MKLISYQPSIVGGATRKEFSIKKIDSISLGGLSRSHRMMRIENEIEKKLRHRMFKDWAGRIHKK